MDVSLKQLWVFMYGFICGVQHKPVLESSPLTDTPKGKTWGEVEGTLGEQGKFSDYDKSSNDASPESLRLTCKQWRLKTAIPQPYKRTRWHKNQPLMARLKRYQDQCGEFLEVKATTAREASESMIGCRCLGCRNPQVNPGLLMRCWKRGKDQGWLHIKEFGITLKFKKTPFGILQVIDRPVRANEQSA